MEDQQLTIIRTCELIEHFENSLNMNLNQEDMFELFQQLFDILDHNSPVDLYDRNVLTFAGFMFTNHLTVDRQKADKVAYEILVQLFKILNDQKFYVNGVLLFFPYVMVGKDLACRRFKS